MANLEEKVKAFLSDGKKAEAVANDQKFLDAVSGGTVTNQIIGEEFGKAGLPLSEGEAEEVKDTAKKLLNIPPEKLDEFAAQNISGGLEDETWYKMKGASIGVSLGGAASGLGCWVARTVCQSQAHKAALAGNKDQADRLNKAVKGLDIATVSCLGLATASGIAGAVIHRIDEDSYTAFGRMEEKRNKAQTTKD